MLPIRVCCTAALFTYFITLHIESQLEEKGQILGSKKKSEESKLYHKLPNLFQLLLDSTFKRVGVWLAVLLVDISSSLYQINTQFLKPWKLQSNLY